MRRFGLALEGGTGVGGGGGGGGGEDKRGGEGPRDEHVKNSRREIAGGNWNVDHRGRSEKQQKRGRDSASVQEKGRARIWRDRIAEERIYVHETNVPRQRRLVAVQKAAGIGIETGVVEAAYECMTNTDALDGASHSWETVEAQRRGKSHPKSAVIPGCTPFNLPLAGADTLKDPMDSSLAGLPTGTRAPTAQGALQIRPMLEAWASHLAEDSERVYVIVTEKLWTFPAETLGCIVLFCRDDSILVDGYSTDNPTAAPMVLDSQRPPSPTERRSSPKLWPVLP
ncbi:hypothetical protein DFH09DRAFT_1399949 [Mycena vulgaris]|nr:hypothetical protein DFH09DRAFT_1399949 [Mycena vulgaris]